MGTSRCYRDKISKQEISWKKLGTAMFISLFEEEKRDLDNREK